MKDKSNKRRKEKRVDAIYIQPWEEFKTFLFIEKKQSQSPSNYQAQKSRYTVLLSYFKDQPLTRESFNQFISYLQSKSHKPSYINNFIKLCKLIAESNRIESFKDYTYFKEKKNIYVDTLSPEEITQLAEVDIPYRYRKKEINYRMKTLILLLGRTGCRIGEAFGLKWNDVHENYIIFRDTKNGEDRLVPLKPSLYTLLIGLPRGEYVFENRLQNEINKDLKRRAKACGINKLVYCHLFRHSYITEMTRQKVPISYIARIVGHKNLESTNHYTHTVLEDVSYMMTYHPLEKIEQTFTDVSDKIKEFVERVVDTSRFTCIVSSQEGELQVTIHT